MGLGADLAVQPANHMYRAHRTPMIAVMWFCDVVIRDASRVMVLLCFCCSLNLALYQMGKAVYLVYIPLLTSHQLMNILPPRFGPFLVDFFIVEGHLP